MSPDESTDKRLLLRGRFTFGLKHAIAAAMVGSAIAAIVAISNVY